MTFDDFTQLTLHPEIMNDVIICCTMSPGHFFVQQPTHPTHPNLQKLDYMMKLNYLQPNVPGVPSAVPGMICVVQTGNNWYRAHVKSVSESGQDCEVVLVDYGGYANVPVSSLKPIKIEFLNLPFQACECYLYNVAPVDGKIFYFLVVSFINFVLFVRNQRLERRMFKLFL